MTDAQIAKLFDEWYESLPIDDRMAVNRHYKKLIRIRNLGPNGVRALLAKLYVCLGDHK